MPSPIRLQFKALIQASVSKVWAVMLGPDTYKKWTAAFAEGSFFEESWSQGSKIRFMSPTGDGVVSEIEANESEKLISIRHLGYVSKGVEDTSSEAVRAWAPAYENYTFTALQGGTLLVIDQDATPEFEQHLREAWPKALASLKVLCEQGAA